MAVGLKTMVDPDFGSLKFCVDSWDGLAPFAFEPGRATHFDVHILAPETGPTSAQQTVYRDLKSRYGELWPEIAQNLVKCFDGVSSVDELCTYLSPTVGLYMIEEFDDPSQAEIELVYDINRPDVEGRSCFVRIRPWEVIEAALAE